MIHLHFHGNFLSPGRAPDIHPAMPEAHNSKDPLHGMTLEKILVYLEAEYGWEELGLAVKIRCFTSDPSISSSLKFLRKTPWARKKVEQLYVDTVTTAVREWDVPES